MTTPIDVPRIAIQVSRDIVIASIQVELEDAVLDQFRKDLLERVQKTGARGVIFDVSGLDILDAHEFSALRDLITMTRLLGAETVLSGLQPGIVSALVTIGADIDGLEATIDLDSAFAVLESKTESDSDLAFTADEEAEDPVDPVEFDPSREVAR
jgi:rsbT antagonist protein RsbS